MSRFHALEIAEIRPQTRDSVSIGFRIPPDLRPVFAFQPGQYITLRAKVEGEDLRRPYSICSAPGEEFLRVGIKRVDGGAFSKFATQSLKIGDRLEVMPPEGRFLSHQAAQGPRHVLGIAAGSGITPILSIAKAALGSDPHTQFTLIYGNRTSSSVMFSEEIEDLKNTHLARFTVLHVLSREAQDVPVLSGRIDAARLKMLGEGVIPFHTLDEAFLCGPEGMVMAAKAGLEALGVATTRIRTEIFTPAAPRTKYAPEHTAPTGAVLAEVTALLDGKAYRFPFRAGDETLIDAAAREGIDLPYSCKGGMCCTCRCKVEEGEAEMALHYSLEPWELEAGFVLACQSIPKTPVLKVTFDEL